MRALADWRSSTRALLKAVITGDRTVTSIMRLLLAREAVVGSRLRLSRDMFVAQHERSECADRLVRLQGLPLDNRTETREYKSTGETEAGEPHPMDGYHHRGRSAHGSTRSHPLVRQWPGVES
jgi:hypothetical protein